MYPLLERRAFPVEKTVKNVDGCNALAGAVSGWQCNTEETQPFS